MFSLEGIMEESKRIAGYMHDPESGSWKSMNIHYPSSVISIIEASLTRKLNLFNDKMKHLLAELGPHLFNYPHFSKWEMYKMLSPTLSHALPDTICYQDPVDVLEMVVNHGSVYVKPINGRLGKQIYKIHKTQKKIIVEYIHRRKKKVLTFSSNKDFLLFVQKQLIRKAYLIQQAIQLKTYNRRVVDFRMIIVKNEVGKWENIGIFSRFGAKGSVVSNISAGGLTELADATLEKLWKWSKEEVHTIKTKMVNIAYESLQIIEQRGYHFGNIGFDFGLDEYGSLYIIEINHQNPDPYIALKAKQKKLFYLTRYKNMLYAKKLAGFGK